MNGMSFKQYKYSMGTLIWMAKQNNLDKFNEWKDKYCRPNSLIHLYYNFHKIRRTSQYFHNHNKNLCHYYDKVWRILDKDNRWFKWDDISYLMITISEFFESEFNKLKEYYQNKKIQYKNDLELINDQKRIDEKTIIVVSLTDDESHTITNEIFNEDQIKIKQKEINAKISALDEKIKQIDNKISTQLCDPVFLEKIIKFLRSLYYNNEIVFDRIPHLIGFKSNVYDLNKKGFRPIEATDYISLSTGYDIEDRDEEKIKYLYNLITKIMPDEESRECLLSIYARALFGKTSERFIILNGKGRNGKGVLNELMRKVFGQYAYTLKVATLCHENKTGANPDIANCSDKRLIIASEAKERIGFDNDTMKSFSGGNVIHGRQLYSKNTEVHLCCTLMIECNNKPYFQDAISDAEVERLIDIKFLNRFTTNRSKVDNKNIFMADEYYKTEEFQNTYKSAMMWILIDTYHKYNGQIYVPDSVLKRSEEYFTDTDPIFKWFRANYEPCELSEDPNNIFINARYIYTLDK